MNNNSYVKGGTQNSSNAISGVIMHIMHGLRKRGWMLPIITCMIMCGFLYYSYTTHNEYYQATATLSVTSKEANVSSYSNKSYNATTYQLIKTFPYLISSSNLTKVVADDLGMGYVPGTISASALSDTSMFTITVTSNSYGLAYRILKSVINNYSTVAEYVIGETDIVIVIPPSASSEPLYPIDFNQRALYGFVFGIIVSMVIIVMFERFTFTIRTPDDIEKILNNDRLGTIVKVINKKSSNATNVVSLENSHVDSRFKESMYTIRNTVIKKCKEEKINSVMLTSTAAGEGKTTLSSNLAISLAKKGYRTIIIDGDLRHPSVRKQMNLPFEEDMRGIVDVVTGGCSLEDAIIKLQKSGLYVLPGTIPVENAAEIMASQQMEDLIEALKKLFDYVIVDAPPVGLVADALEVKDLVGGVIFVVRQDYTKIGRILNAISSFSGSRIKMLGCIFNMAQGAMGSKYYSKYGYSAYGRYGGYYGYGYGYGRYGYGRYGYGGYGSYGYGGYGSYGESDDDDDDENSDEKDKSQKDDSSAEKVDENGGDKE